MASLCPLCGHEQGASLPRHIKAEHNEAELQEAVLQDKRNGVSDVEIGERYGVSFNFIQRAITKAYGANVSIIGHRKARITQWAPKSFQLERTTVWSFRSRGNWATHDGRYRGNWSPYVPRNVMLQYSQPRDLVLDYFAGGGTTAVEAKLLGRRCIGLDINPDALALARDNTTFHDAQPVLGKEVTMFEPELVLGDARDLSFIGDESVDLICAHPPYAGIISYSVEGTDADLSKMSVPEFLREMGKVARESLRVLKPGSKCAILIGDSRKAKRVVPVGFQTIRVFLDAGFELHDLVIKRQHNCKTTGFWYTNSVRYNFLLLAHEYLPIFEKPKPSRFAEPSRPVWLPDLGLGLRSRLLDRIERENLETMTVWIFPAVQIESEIRRNVLGRFGTQGASILDIEVGVPQFSEKDSRDTAVAYIHCPSNDQLTSGGEIGAYLLALDKAVYYAVNCLAEGGHCVVEARDVRVNGQTQPLGLLAFEHLTHSGLELREIVVVTTEENKSFVSVSEDELAIVHRYLLIYRVTGQREP